MKTPEDAEVLARACLALARGWGRAADVAVTDMSQPLGDAIGNALDVIEAVELLRGTFRGTAAGPRRPVRGDGRWRRPREPPIDEAVARAEHALDGGEALERFRAMVEAQGGDPRVVDDPRAILPAAPVVAADRGRPGRYARRRGCGGDRHGERRARRGPDPQGRPDRPRRGYRGPLQDRRPARGRAADRGGPRAVRRRRRRSDATGAGGVHA